MSLLKEKVIFFTLSSIFFGAKESDALQFLTSVVQSFVTMLKISRLCLSGLYKLKDPESLRHGVLNFKFV